MQVSLDYAIRKKIIEVLLDELALREFEEWVVPATWNMDRHVPLDTQDMVHEMVTLIVDWNDDEISDVDVKSEMNPYVTNIHFSAGSRQVTGTPASSVAALFTIQPQTPGIRAAMVSV